jgi:hypothetical protein
MTRFVNKPHGFVITSGNEFFVSDNPPMVYRAVNTDDRFVLPDGVNRTRDGYRAIVSLRDFKYETITSLNAMIETPAQQAIWRQHRIDIPYTIDLVGMPLGAVETVSWLGLTSSIFIWLERNVGPRYIDWDTYTWAQKGRNDSLFFRTRKSALAFVNHVIENIDYKGYQ